MRSKLFGRLMSFTLSATVALTSGIPSLAYDGGGGDLPEEDEEIQLLDEDEEAGSDFDAPEFEDEIDDIIIDDSEFTGVQDININLVYGVPGLDDTTVHPDIEGSDSSHGKFTSLPTLPEVRGYHNDGNWYLSSSLTGATLNGTTELEDGANLYAKYTLNKVTVSAYEAVFFNEDGTLASESQPSFSGLSTTNEDYSETFDFGEQPTVTGYSSDGWYSSSECNTTAQAYLNEAYDDVTFTKLYAKYTKITAAGDLQIVTNDTWNYTYAAESNDKVTYTAQVRNSENTAWGDFTDATWSLYKIKGDIGTASTDPANPRYASSNLEAVTSLADYGISFTQPTAAKQNLVFSTTGPKKALDGQFLLKIVDNNDATKVAVFEDNFIINDGEVVTSKDTGSDPRVLGTVTFTPATMGYKVLGVGETSTSAYTAAQKVVVSTSTIGSTYKLDDLTYEFDGDKDAFTVAGDGKGLWIANNETLTISPVEGLDNYNDADHDGVYEATLYAKSKAFAVEFPLVYVEFDVSTNLGFSTVTAHGGSDASIMKDATDLNREADTNRVFVSANASVDEDAVALGYYKRSGASAPYTYTKCSGTDIVSDTSLYYLPTYDLGTIALGESFSDMLIVAEGGVDKIVMESDKVAATPGAATYGLADGISGLPTDAAGRATYSISGKATNAAQIGRHTVYLRAIITHEDSSVDATEKVAFTYTIDNPDTSVTFDGEALTLGITDGTDNNYKWTAFSTYTSSAAEKSLVITNNSEDSITFTVYGYSTQANYPSTKLAASSADFTISGLTAFAEGGADDGNLGGTIAVPSGSSKVIKVAPKASLTAGSHEVILGLTATGVDATNVNLDFNVLASTTEFAITKPTGSPYAMDAYLGDSFTYEIETIKTDKVSSVEWTITNVTGGDVTFKKTAAADKAAEYGISLNKSTGILVGIPKQVARTTPLEVTVSAAYKVDGITQSPLTQTFNITITGSKDEFSLTAEGKKIDDEKNILDLGTVTIDQIETVEQTFAIENVSSLDIATAKAVIDTGAIKRGTTLAGATTGSYTNFFELVFDKDNSALNTTLKAGFELKKDETRVVTFKLGSAFTKEYANAGTYWIPVIVTDQADATGSASKFIVKLTVKDVPIIGDAAINPGAPNNFVVSKEVKKAASTHKYTITVGGVATDKAADFTWAWTKGSVPGLTLDETGVIYGTATQAGEFEVTVTATNKKDSTVKGVLTHKVTVDGNATVNISSTALGGDPSGKFVLLPGIVVGSETNAIAETFNLTSSDDTAKNVVITVEDAPDDRTDLAAIKKSPENPYKGSVNYIGTNKTGFSEITTKGTENFSIVTKSSVAPGVYKVKITITADNANKKEFYVIMAVVDKFAITQPGNIATKVGKTYAAADRDLEILTKGGAGGQVIEWSEAGTKVTSGTTETTEYYVTSSGTADTASTITDFVLKKASHRIDGKATNATTPATVNPAVAYGSKTILTTTSAVKKSGTFTVTLKAKVAAADVNTSIPDEMSKIISLSGDANIIKATTTKAFPEQEAAPVTFTITSAKSDEVTIIGVTDTSSVGTVEGFKNGTEYITRTGFTYNPVVPTYTNTGYGIGITVKNNMAGISTKAKAAFTDGSKFEVVGGDEKNIAANANDSFTIRPKSKIPQGVYTDTLTITGNEFETISFTVKFTVEDESYLADISGTVDGETVKYVEKNVKTDKTVVLNNYVVDTSGSTDTLSVKNVGNTILSNVKAYEVKADGTKYAENSSDTMLYVGVISTSIDVGATKSFSIEAKKNKAGVYTTYVNLHFTEGTSGTATERDVFFPVTYTVYSKDIDEVSVSPETKTSITVAENYNPKDAAAEFVVKNNAVGPENTVTGFKVESQNSDFEVLPATTKDLKAGESATYKIQPKKGKMLSAGEYTTKLKVYDGNIKTAIEREITLVVTESNEYTVKATSSGVLIDDADIAKKLWNAFVYGQGLAISPTTSTSSKTVEVDVDEDGANDIALTFTTSAAATTYDEVLGVSDVTATILSTNSISTASKAIALKATEQKAAAEGIGDTGNDTDGHNAKFFSSVTFNLYATVVFGTGSTKYTETKEELDNDYVTAPANDSTEPKTAKGQITARVPYGATLGSVFTSGKLPVSVVPGQVMTAWKSGTVIMAANKAIYKDYDGAHPTTTPQAVLTADFHAHVYAAANNKDEKFVKWVWTTDEKGNLSAVLHLHCTDPDCPDYAGSEVVIYDNAKMTSAVTAKIPGWSAGDYGVTYSARAGKDADCEHGSRYEYPAEAKYKGIVYKNSKVEDEEGEPLGHQFNLKVDPDIVWTDKNEDGLMTADEVKVTRTCTRCGEPIELTVVSVSEKDKVEPTCTKAGSVQYVITFTDVTEDGKIGSNKEQNYKDVTVLKAKGHAKELLAEVTDFDEETLIAAKLKLTCPDCNEVLFEKTNVQFTKNADGSYGYKALIASTGEYYDVSYTNHAHVWEGEWSWASDYSKATLTITCKQGTKPEVKEFTVDSVETVKGAMHTYAVSYTYTWTEKGEAKTKTFEDSKQIVKSDDGQVVEDIIPVDETLGIYIEGLAEEYYFTNAPIKPVFYVIDTSEGLNYLAQGVDYTVSYKNNKKLGDTATVTVKGKGNYSGQSAIATFKIVDPMKDVEQDEVEALKGAKVTLTPATYVYNGMPQYPESITLQLKGKSAVVYKFDGSAYVSEAGDAIPAVVTFANNINKGTATVLLTGKNGTNGKATTVKKTFKIKAASLESTGFEVEAADTVWAVKGAQPAVSVTWNGASLIQGQDFTVKYANNKKVGEAAKVIVTGKGNFSKKIEKTFKVTELHLDDEMLAAISATAGKKGVKVTLLDPAGNVIPAAKYTVTVLDGETDVTKAKLEADKDYTLKIVRSAKGIELSADDEIVVTFQAGIDIKSAKVDAKSVIKTYTGEAIVLDDEDIAKIAVTYKGAALKYGEDYEIKGYANNIKKGNMTVTIAGIGKYSGVKTFKVKIAPKPLVR